MFVGHYGAAFFAKGFSPSVPLWTLLFACVFVDVLWAVFVLGGLEHARLDPQLPSNPLDLYFMPFTHGLVANVLWTGVAFGVARWWLRSQIAAAVVAATVASHWFLDLIVHRPDLPLVTGPPKLGLALWNHPLAAYGVEVGFVVAGLAFCLVLRPAVSGRTRAVALLGAALIAVHTIALLAPVPHSVPLYVSSALVFFVAVPWVGRRIA